jgi:hypothetical protein
MDPSIGAIKTQGNKGTESTTCGAGKIFQRGEVEGQWLVIPDDRLSQAMDGG